MVKYCARPFSEWNNILAFPACRFHYMCFNYLKNDAVFDFLFCFVQRHRNGQRETLLFRVLASVANSHSADRIERQWLLWGFHDSNNQRKFQRISCMSRKTNDLVRSKINLLMGSQEPLLATVNRAPWRMPDAVVGRRNARWTTSKSERSCLCQNCSRWLPAGKGWKKICARSSLTSFGTTERTELDWTKQLASTLKEDCFQSEATLPFLPLPPFSVNDAQHSWIRLDSEEEERSHRPHDRRGKLGFREVTVVGYKKIRFVCLFVCFRFFCSCFRFQTTATICSSCFSCSTPSSSFSFRLHSSL